MTIDKLQNTWEDSSVHNLLGWTTLQTMHFNAIVSELVINQMQHIIFPSNHIIAMLSSCQCKIKTAWFSVVHLAIQLHN